MISLEFFLEWEMFLTNVGKIKTHVLCAATFSRKSCRLWVNVETTQTALLRFHCNSGYANAPQYYVIRIWPVFLLFFMWLSSCYTSEVWTACLLSHCSSKKHFAPVIKFCELLIDLLIRLFKELAIMTPVDHWTSPLPVCETVSRSSNFLPFHVCIFPKVASLRSVFMTKFYF
jgi:hypothetical protein